MSRGIILPPNEWDKPQDECGIFGISYSQKEGVYPAYDAYHALYALQHRGQESCGIAVNRDGVISVYKDAGLVPDVFDEKILNNMPGNMAIGHCRYSGERQTGRENAQPILVQHIKGNLAIAYNGGLTNVRELRAEIEMSGGIFQTSSDVEIISHVIVRERLNARSIEQAVKGAMHRLRGAYCMVLMSPRKLIAARDPYGVRPLCIGKLNGSYIFASESCALSALGADFVRDVLPGEIVTCVDGELHSMHCGIKVKSAACVFEYIYTARPDSVIDGASVELARQEAGRALAQDHPVDADIVIGAPDSGLPAAIGYAKESGIHYDVGLIKNRYVGRTFIQPDQRGREKAVRIKLSPLIPTIEGKRVVMVDDSVVRGTTCARIVRMLREAGAKEVHMRISSPPFLHPCYFGTDVPDEHTLVAYNRSVEDIRELFGADSLGYLSLEKMHKIAPKATVTFCDACFSGNYPIKPPCKDYENIYQKGLSE